MTPPRVLRIDDENEPVALPFAVARNSAPAFGVKPANVDCQFASFTPKYTFVPVSRSNELLTSPRAESRARGVVHTIANTIQSSGRPMLRCSSPAAGREQPSRSRL